MLAGWHPAYLAIVAAAPMALLGLLVFSRNPGRGVNRAFFAFTLLNGAAMTLVALVTANAGTDEALGWIRTFWYLDPWLSVLLVALALHIPTPSGFLLRRPIVAHALLVAPAAVITGVYAVDHSFLIELREIQGIAYYGLTPLGLAVIGLRGVAIGAALLVLARRFRLTPHALQRRQLAWTQAAFHVGFVPTLGLMLYHQFQANPSSPATFGFLAGALLANGAALWSFRPWDGSLLKDDERQLVLVAYVGGTSLTLAFAALSVGSAFAAAVHAAATTTASSFVLAYAVLKYDLFGLDLRLRQAAPYVTLSLLLGGAFVFFAAAAAKLSPAADMGRLFMFAGVLTAATAIPMHRVSTRITTRFGWTRAANTQGAVAERRLELYRAAVENAATRGEDLEENEVLKDLRQRLALSTRDHRFMLQAVLDDANARKGAPPGPLREGDVVMRKYRVERFLGSGSFGRALLAHHVSMNRAVVIKEPHQGFRSRTALQQLSKEAQLVSRVRHENVVQLYDFEELADTGYLVFEYVSGGSLDDLLRAGPAPREQAYAIFRDVLMGLDAIHRARIVHMDLKPANILIDEEGRAKITDFGIATEIRSDAATLARSIGPQAHPGTLLYMAPEQVRGRRDPGPLADLYAAGAIFHEMLTGKRYLDFPDAPLLIQEAILYQEPRLDDPRLTPWEQDILSRLLAKAPADRPSVAEVIAQIDRLAAGNPKAGSPYPSVQAATREA